MNRISQILERKDFKVSKLNFLDYAVKTNVGLKKIFLPEKFLFIEK